MHVVLFGRARWLTRRRSVKRSRYRLRRPRRRVALYRSVARRRMSVRNKRRRRFVVKRRVGKRYTRMFRPMMRVVHRFSTPEQYRWYYGAHANELTTHDNGTYYKWALGDVVFSANDYAAYMCKQYG